MEDKKLIRVYKKVTVEEVSIWEKPKLDFVNLHVKDDDGSDKYGYVKKGEETEKEETSETLYEQKFDDGDLNVKELTLWANRVK